MFILELNIDKAPGKITSAIDVSDALEHIFDHPSPALVIVINDLSISLPLCYVFSEMLDDFLTLLIDLRNSNEFSGLYGFSQNEVFDADWQIDVQDDMLEVSFVWRKFPDFDSLDSLPMSIRISKVQFMNEWSNLFLKLIPHLEGIDFDDRSQMETLREFAII